jgi:hypothetical protein
MRINVAGSDRFLRPEPAATHDVVERVGRGPVRHIDVQLKSGPAGAFAAEPDAARRGFGKKSTPALRADRARATEDRSAPAPSELPARLDHGGNHAIAGTPHHRYTAQIDVRQPAERRSVGGHLQVHPRWGALRGLVVEAPLPSKNGARPYWRARVASVKTSCEKAIEGAALRCRCHHIREVVFAAALLLAATPAFAQIYGGRDASGTVILSDFRSELAVELLVEPPRAVDPRAWTADKAARAPLRAKELSGLIREVARAQDVSPQLLHAVIAVESGFDPRAVSRKGAMGLMQLMPGTARRFNVSDPFDPRQNLEGGATYLKWLLEKFGGDVRLALAGYNAGENAVIRAGFRIPAYDETQAYVPRVLRQMARVSYE